MSENNVYKLQVEIECNYLPEQSQVDQSIFAFAYTVRITNTGTITSQVISRHWLILDESGLLTEVKGLGIVGQQPLLSPGETFEYTSVSQISTPNGVMKGNYFCVAEDGHRFEVPIEQFFLGTPRTLH